METQEKNIELLYVKELPFNLNREVVIDKEMLRKIQMSFILVLQYNETSDMVELHIRARYMIDDKMVLMESGGNDCGKIIFLERGGS